MVNIHTSRIDEFAAKGYVAVVKPGGHPDRIWMADPLTTCLHPLRDGPCEGDKDHRGRHSTVWFYCDACGKSRRGEPFRRDYDADGEPDTAFCFMCIRDLVSISPNAANEEGDQ
jgi:hypothetical protein